MIVTFVAFALGFSRSIFADHVVESWNNTSHSFYSSIFQNMRNDAVAVVYDSSTDIESRKILKFASQQGIPVFGIDVMEASHETKLGNFPRQIIVLCDYSNISHVIRHFSKNGMLAYPNVWLFVTEEDLSSMFTDDNLGLAFAVSKSTSQVILYTKGCRGLNVTRSHPKSLESFQTFSVTLSHLNVLKACHLRVIVMSLKPSTQFHGKVASGFDIDFITTLAEYMEFKLSFDEMPYDDGGFNKLFLLMERNEYDIMLPCFAKKAARLKMAKYPSHVYNTHWLGIIKRRPILDDATSVFKPLALQTWILTVITVIVITICYALTSILHRKDGIETSKKSFYVYAAFLQQESKPREVSTSGRMVLCLTSASSLIIMTAYSSDLYAVLSSTKPNIPFSTLAEMNENSKFKPLLHIGSEVLDLVQNSRLEDFHTLNLKTLIPCGAKCIVNTTLQGSNTVITEENFIFFTFENIYYALNQNCEFDLAIDNVLKAKLFIIFQKAFRHSDYVYAHIMRLKECGIVQRIYRDIKKRRKCAPPKINMGIAMLYFPFVAYIIGVILSVITLAVEMFFYEF